MALWRMTDGGPVKLSPSRLDLESRLEELIKADPSMVGLDVLVLGQQVPTAFGGFIDLLALDSQGVVHVLELKRDRTPRDVVSQTLDYGSWVHGLSLDDLEGIYEGQDGDDLADAFAERFGQPLPETVNADQQLTVIASELDPASDRIIEYLAETYAVPINASFFRYFGDEDREYLARTWLLDPATVEPTTARTSRSKTKPWNGRDFYCIQGRVDDEHNRWEMGRTHGFVSAAGGEWYSKPLRNLKPGHRALAYVGGAGYVGIGEVTGEVRPLAEMTDASGTRLIDLPGFDARMAEWARTLGPEETEYVVPVSWFAAVPTAEAKMTSGLFANQLSACRLTDARTIEFVEDAFGLTDSRGG